MFFGPPPAHHLTPRQSFMLYFQISLVLDDFQATDIKNQNERCTVFICS